MWVSELLSYWKAYSINVNLLVEMRALECKKSSQTCHFNCVWKCVTMRGHLSSNQSNRLVEIYSSNTFETLITLTFLKCICWPEVLEGSSFSLYIMLAKFGKVLCLTACEYMSDKFSATGMQAAILKQLKTTLQTKCKWNSRLASICHGPETANRKWAVHDISLNPENNLAFIS